METGEYFISNSTVFSQRINVSDAN